MPGPVRSLLAVLLVWSASSAEMLDYVSSQYLLFNGTYEVSFAPQEQLAVEANTQYINSSGYLETGPLAAMIGPAGTDALAILHQSVYVFSISATTGALTLQYSFDLTAADGRQLGCPRFMQLPYDPLNPEWCLVVPNRASETLPGSIDIIRLQKQGETAPVVCHNRLAMPTPPSGWTRLSNVYSISYVPIVSTTPYCISAEYEDEHDVNGFWSFFGLASFVTDKFVVDASGRNRVLDVYYGNTVETNPTRPCESQLCEFVFGGESSSLFLSTSHNGGVVIWDHSGISQQDAEVVSQILTPQHGWDQGAVGGIGELGDTHRAVVLEGADFSVNGDAGETRLLFFANNTMGFCVYDISNPASPQFIWQWDGDTREPANSTGDWDWCGTICPVDGEDLAIPPQSSQYPGRAFGIDLVSNENSGYIRLFLGDCADGLLSFDLSNFLNPFAIDTPTRCFDGISEEVYWPAEAEPDELCGAFDTRVLDGTGHDYLVTSWMLPGSNRIAISVHEITGGEWLAGGGGAGYAQAPVPALLQREFSMIGSRPNPASGEFSLSVRSPGSQRCAISVFDISGRVVRSFGMDLAPGENEIVWDCRDGDGSEVPSGTYLLRVDDESGNEIVEKMAVL
ncbi:MAG: FlgD immunoglobulin-like domain containing protein [Candidatus Fermentibacter sp.]|nr:FlgD immunoglobulin-like domain containing protein [Candidatus Fermentibacter sp.]